MQKSRETVAMNVASSGISETNTVGDEILDDLILQVKIHGRKTEAEELREGEVHLVGSGDCM